MQLPQEPLACVMGCLISCVEFQFGWTSNHDYNIHCISAIIKLGQCCYVLRYLAQVFIFPIHFGTVEVVLNSDLLLIFCLFAPIELLSFHKLDFTKFQKCFPFVMLEQVQ